MANSITNAGQTEALTGSSIVAVATKLKLYTNATTPLKDGTGFTEVANGNGYTTGGVAILPGDWTSTLDTGNVKVTLADQVWTASGGSIANVMGAFITDAADNPLAWWERTSVTTVASGDTVTAAGLFLKLT